tara:strand:- start:110 stop:280 length:171 start_codon:yes stop_codon:yes gene_type:complete
MQMSYTWGNGASGGGTYRKKEVLRERLYAMVDALVDRAAAGEARTVTISVVSADKI